MNKKGQISLDLIIAIIITFIFAGAMQSIIAGMNETQKEIGVINQQKEIGNKISEILTTSKNLADGSFNVKYLIPNVIVLGNKESGCNIAITQGQIKISSVFDSKVIESTIIHNSSILYLKKANPKCGEYVEIQKI
ncbi:MAG: hypothetical protein COT15_01385 [Candidatus Diapherotrites archaeon CG08_land_8_20_14_0_20_34_12]|nr:MAG: hypothetical protein COT15_01385 [Candidatus Diapherotrites archaeon CG08_land_8_20_14_0_20_34_12]